MPARRKDLQGFAFILVDNYSPILAKHFISYAIRLTLDINVCFMFEFARISQYHSPNHTGFRHIENILLFE